MTQQPNNTAETCLLSADDVKTILQADYQQTDELELPLKLSFINSQFMKKAVMYIAGLTIFTASYYHTRKQLDYIAAQEAASSTVTTDVSVAPSTENNLKDKQPPADFPYAAWR